jgi:hypothetical protein
MKKFFAVITVYLLVCTHSGLAYDSIDFTLHKLESGRPGNTLLVIGGIQGDEPGGFNAASLLVTHYNIKKGNVWVVPNLNFISIIKRTRGVYGDLNRKFASLRSADPEFDTIGKIKSIILDGQVDVVLNHHDGSGFYRLRYIDRTRNPYRWGQSIIIDQERIKTERYGNLSEIAKEIVTDVNSQLFSEEHSYHVKNTRTRQGDKEMAKTLTYYAIRNSKPAFGVEVSKSFPTHKRAYYHLRVIEAYMDLLGIEYDRSFNLSAKDIKKAIDSNVKLAFYDNRIFLDVANARKRLRYIPLKKASEVSFIPSNPLIAVVKSGKSYRVFHGNRRITRLYPEYFDYDSSINGVSILIDGEEKKVVFGETVYVDKSFLVLPKTGYRVNVIGFKRPDVVNESGIAIEKNHILKRFSVDKTGYIYRVEVYCGKKFSGMVLVNFDDKHENLIASNPSEISPVSAAGQRNNPIATGSPAKIGRSSSLGR